MSTHRLIPNVRRYSCDETMALQARLRAALHGFQQSPLQPAALGILTSEATAYAEGQAAGAIPFTPQRPSVLKQRAVQAMHEALDDLTHGGDPEVLLSLARTYRDLNKELNP